MFFMPYLFGLLKYVNQHQNTPLQVKVILTLAVRSQEHLPLFADFKQFLMIYKYNIFFIQAD
jgi:hypothetical protein